MIEARGEAVLILGDLNRAVGQDELGVAGNSPDLSYGGKLVRELVATEEYVLFNNLALVEGGPWTREDPGDGGLSCLDLAIGSRNLLPFLESMVVDSDRKFTPQRAVYIRGRLTVKPTDHFSLLLGLKMPRKEKKQKQPTIWNKQKPGGWEAYEKETDAAKEKIEDIINDTERSVDDVMKKLDSLQTKIKHATLGKTKLKTKKNQDREKSNETDPTNEEHAKRLMRKESEKIENAILEVTSSKIGGCGQLFKMRDVVQGPRKAGQEAQAVVDSRTGELVVASSAIKQASLEYCLDTLQKNEPKEGFKKLIEAKRKLHELRMLQKDGNFEVTEDFFWKVMAKFERKRKRSYDFLTKAGKGFKEAMYKFCKRLNLEETFPSRFDQTYLVQLYKLKGPVQQLSSHRYLHMKEWTVRLVEALEVEGMKDSILEAGTRFQLGGKPGMRVQYHLFTVKSVMALKEQNKEGGILWGVDLMRFFDKEVLVDCLDTAAETEIDPRIYRNLFRLNQRCRVSVVTGSGISEEGEAGETVGQGSGAASLISQLKVDLGLHSYFSSSGDQEYYGCVRLQPLSWQDDVVGLGGSDPRLVQASLVKLAYFVDESQLEIHPDRSKSTYIVYGNKRSREKLIKETEEEPLMVGAVKLQRSEAMTYLGEVLHQDGLAASADATVDLRVARVKGAIFEIKALCEDFRMQICGGMVGAIKLFKSCVVPKLLANSGVWVEISNTTIAKLDAIQNLFVQVLLRLPSSTTLVAYRAETGLIGMKWQIWENKLMLVASIKEQREEVLAKQMLEQQLEWDWPGLGKEVTDICREVGLPDLCQEEVDKKEIQDAIFFHHLKDLNEEMKKFSKLEDISNGDFRNIQSYMKHHSMEFSRMAFRLRTKMFRCRANMPKLFGDVLWCHSCSSGPDDGPSGGGPAPPESQRHLEQCVAYSHLRVGKDVELNFEDKVEYFLELTVERDKQKWH